MKFKTSKKIFIHIDCDSFFAECEILKDPSLRDKYVLVGREIVLACNYKTKALWIKTGDPVWKVESILKWRGVFCSPDHNFYTYISGKMMQYLEENTLSMEAFSIDEAFCEITGLPELFKMSLDEYIVDLQKKVMDHIGVWVSIGVSTTKIKAKIFSKLKKPQWIYIDISNSREVYETLPIAIVPFIGRSMQNYLKYNCVTVYDFVNLGYWYLKKHIGKSATDLWLELTGVNAYTMKKSPYSKSMSRGRSFNKHITSNKEFVYSQLLENFNHLYEELTLRKYKTKKVSIFFRDKQKITHIFHVNLAEYTMSRQDLFQALQKLFSSYYNEGCLYRSTGVVFGNLEKIRELQLNLFHKEKVIETSNTQLIKAINSLNKRFDSHVVSFGTDLVGKRFDSKLGIMK